MVGMKVSAVRYGIKVMLAAYWRNDSPRPASSRRGGREARRKDSLWGPVKIKVCS